MAPWKLPFVVLAIAVPIVAGFAVAGPGLGLAVGALVAVAIVFVAARQQPRGAIVARPATDARRHLLVVAGRAVEGEGAVAEIVAAAAPRGGDAAAEVLVLAPARIGFLDRWASDVEPARRAAQRNLVLTVAALAKAGVEAEARVGDEDLVQAVEDQLRSFPATDVVLATGEPAEDPAGEAAAAELRERLQSRFNRVVVRGPAAR